MRILCCLCLVLPTIAAAQSFPCEPSDEVRSEIHAATHIEASQGIPREKARQSVRERLREVIAKHPNDVWVQRARINSERDYPAALVEHYRVRAEARPDDPEAQYLYAYALQGNDTLRAVDILTALTAKHPGFVLPWITLAQIYTYPKFEDRSKARHYAERALEACPGFTEVPFLLRFVENRDKLAKWASLVRSRIEGKTEAASIHLWNTLWTVEFRLAPAEKQVAARERVARDLKFLESIEPRTPLIRMALRQGYDLTGDGAAKEKLGTETEPRSAIGEFFRGLNEWSRNNPRRLDNPESTTDHFRKRLAFLDPWVKKLPDNDFVLLERLTSLAALTDTPDEVLRAEGAKILALSRSEAMPPARLRVAQIWAKRGLELDRIPAIVEQGREESRQHLERMAGSMRSDLFDTRGNELIRENQKWYSDTLAWTALILAHARRNDGSAARKALAEYKQALDSRRNRAEEIQSRRDAEKQRTATPVEAGKAGNTDRERMLEDDLVRGLPFAESDYYDVVGELAAAEGRKLDSLAARQAAIRVRAGARALPAHVEQTDSGRAAVGLWKELGGTDEGWKNWLDSLRSNPRSAVPGSMHPGRWTETQPRRLPEFSLPDQGGKTWTLASLNGKVTLINVWATWCPPCREELPFLQKLHDQLKNRPELQVITFNVDENPGVIEPFLRQHKYTFPVISANSIMDTIGCPNGIPANWIVDADGFIRSQLIGFGGNGDDWIRDALAKMEALRSSRQQAAN